MTTGSVAVVLTGELDISTVDDAQEQIEAAEAGSPPLLVIDLSRLQGGEPLPELVPVDIDRVIAEAVDRTRTAARAKDLEIAVGGEHGLVVRGVESQLATAVTNLLANAVAYSEGESRIAVAAQ